MCFILTSDYGGFFTDTGEPSLTPFLGDTPQGMVSPGGHRQPVQDHGVDRHAGL